MAMLPHWIDGAFKSGKDTPEQVGRAMLAMPEFTKAIEAGLAAYRESEQKHAEVLKETGKPFMAPGPEQEARKVFFNALGQETHG